MMRPCPAPRRDRTAALAWRTARREDRAMTAVRTRLVALAALVCGAGVTALVLSSDHENAKAVWAIFGPAVGWSFVGTGIYAMRRRPESRTGELMGGFRFAWVLS